MRRRYLALLLTLMVANSGLLFSGMSSSANEGEPRLVRDINTTPILEPGNFGNFTEAGGTLFMTVHDVVGGEELWKSDGTEAGTQRVKDIAPGPMSSLPQSLTDVNGTLFFTAYEDWTRQVQLWKSDGTEAGTVRVKDITPGPGSWKLQNLTNVGGILFFTVQHTRSLAPDTEYTRRELWKSDGTEAGTFMVKDLRGASPSYLTDVGGTLFFVTVIGTFTRERESLQRCLVLVCPPGGVGVAPGVNSLWKSDGTAEGTVMVKDIAPGPESSDPRQLTNVGGTLFFTARDEVTGRELWKSDGTEAGTVMVKDILLGTGSGDPMNLTNVSGTLFFSAIDGGPHPYYPRHGRELWKSDGTEAGTVLVKDIDPRGDFGDLDDVPGITPPKPRSSSPERLTAVNGTLFFTAHSQFEPSNLWKSDGTDAGTVLLEDVWAGVLLEAGWAGDLIDMDGTLFFTNSLGLWRTDGTAAGTVVVKELTGSILHSLTRVNDILFFMYGYPFKQFAQWYGQLWKSDGFEAGTSVVKSVLYEGNGSSSPHSLTDVNGTLFFAAYEGMTGWELWKSDGTEAGTLLVKDIAPGTTSSTPYSLTNVNGTLFFIAYDEVSGWDLWSSDGTASGTTLVKDFSPPNASSFRGLTNVGGTLFFGFASPTGWGWDLWKSDGTQAGTVRVMDRPSGSLGPYDLTNVDGTLFFVTSDQHGFHLWKSDGTGTGTIHLRKLSHEECAYCYITIDNLTAVGNTLFFQGYHESVGYELWKSDGTVEGTTPVKDILPGSFSSIPDNLTKVGGKLFFTVHDTGVGGGSDMTASLSTELWKSDGTAEGTVKVKEPPPGLYDFSPRNLTDVNGTLFFTAYEDVTHLNDGGRELWKSDGTKDGTVRVKDITPGGPRMDIGDGTLIGPETTWPTDLTNANGTLVFTVYGEYWKSDGTEAGTVKLAGCPGRWCGRPTPMKSTAFFIGNDGVSGSELWALDL